MAAAAAVLNFVDTWPSANASFAVQPPPPPPPPLPLPLPAPLPLPLPLPLLLSFMPPLLLSCLLSLPPVRCRRHFTSFIAPASVALPPSLAPPAAPAPRSLLPFPLLLMLSRQPFRRLPPPPSPAAAAAPPLLCAIAELLTKLARAPAHALNVSCTLRYTRGACSALAALTLYTWAMFTPGTRGAEPPPYALPMSAVLSGFGPRVHAGLTEER